MFTRQGWISSTILYATLLLIPILLYVFFYQSSRIDEATVRNFRSLGAAADRIVETMETLHKVSKNYSLGIDSALLTDLNAACKDYGPPWLGKSVKLLEVIHKTRTQSVKKRKIRTKAVRRGSWFHPPACPIAQFVGDLNECKQGVRIAQSELVSHDCRKLNVRDSRVFNALREHGDDSGLIEILDQFGIEVSMNTKEAFDEPTRHLSVFFDNYFIADENGDVIFAATPRPHSHDEHRRHRTGVPFASIASINDLLVNDSPVAFDIFGSIRNPPVHPNLSSMPTAHSTVRDIQVDDVSLSVFIHPFTADSLKLYVVGVVFRNSLADEAIRLRLGPAVDATLGIALLLTLLPIIRFWIGGDRSTFRRFNLYSVGASVLGASALCTVLLSGAISKSVDGAALDGRLKKIGEAIIDNFRNDRQAVTDGLRKDYSLMSKALDGAEHGSCTPNPAGEGEIGKAIFCPSVCPKSNPLATVPRQVLASYGGLPRVAPRGQEQRRWWPTSSYVLNSDGKRVMCTQYREDHPLNLNLAFREYFSEAEENKLGLYRIDSVVKGEKQIVASSIYSEDGTSEGRVAVGIQKFLSIDAAVLPPHFQYAVIDRSGSMLFHSDRDRIGVSNFLDDTANDAAIRAAMTFGKGKTLEVDYDGTPIRAYIKSINDDVEWTLVVYRSHALVDRISSLATSLSIILWFATTLLTFFVLAIFAVVPRPYGRELLPETVLVCTSGRFGMVAAAWGIFGFAILWNDPGLETLVLVGLLWPIVTSVAIYVLAWYRMLCPRVTYAPVSPRSRSTVVSQSRRRVEVVSVKTLAMTAVVVSFSVVPMLSWHAYFRAGLSDGLAAHLMDDAKRAVMEKRADFDFHTKDLLDERGTGDLQSFLRSSVAGFSERRRDELVASVVAKEGSHERRQEERAEIIVARGHYSSDAAANRDVPSFFWELWPFLAYSPVTQQAMWHRSVGAGSEGVRSVSGAVGRVIGVGAFGESALPEPMVLWALIVLGGTALLLFLCYSVVRTKFGHARNIGHRRLFSVEDTDVFRSQAIRMMLVKRSDRDVKRMMEGLESASVAVKVLRWDGIRVLWDDFAERGRRTFCSDSQVFVVEDLRRATVGERGAKLAEELATKARSCSVILCSDVVPTYHLAPGTFEDRDLAQPVWGDEWRELMVDFEVCVLCCSGRADKVRTKTSSGISEVDELLASELAVNGDMEATLLSIAKRVRNCWPRLAEEDGRLGSVWPRCYKWWREVGQISMAREEVLREIGTAAQSRFKTLWAVSSFDERAQLFALAHGGSPNMRRPAAISSLVSRGLVTDEDPIRLCSESFARFIVEDLDDSLDDWRRKGHGDWWRVTWLPLVLLAGLGLLFFVNSNPETVGVIGAIGAAFIGLVPVITSLFRVGQLGQPTVSSGDE